jgi:hypothetical protein
MFRERIDEVRQDVEVGIRFFGVLPAYLRNPLTPGEARRSVVERLASRERDFLDHLQRTVFEYPATPYHRLLAAAGATVGDIRNLVAAEGLDGALGELFRRGVYLTLEEFKGRVDVVRGSARFRFEPEEFFNPTAGYHLAGESGGSGGMRTPIRFNIWRMRDSFLARRLYYEAVGAEAWEHAIWQPPGGQPILNMLELAAAETLQSHWFSQVDVADPSLNRRYVWSARLLRWGSVIAGRRLPAPETVPLSRPGRIVDWMVGVLADGRVPHLYTTSSAAVRVCLTASEQGRSIAGARFTISGEPATPGRLAVLREAGTRAVVIYGSTDVDMIADACPSGSIDGGMHLLDDLLGVIQPGDDGPAAGLPPTTLMFSTLRARQPMVLINVSVGDQADIVASDCRCVLEGLGWRRKLRNVQSFSKLTAGGLVLLDRDVVNVIENVLPARFGGGPLDYQLVETTTVDGRASLRLVIHPRVGDVDECAAAEALIAAIGGGDARGRVVELQWRQGSMLTVERGLPRVTAAGKVLHVHREQG